MKDVELDMLARLASRRYQQKYIDSATGDEYVREDELIENAYMVMKSVILHSVDPNKERMLNLYTYCLSEGNGGKYGSQNWANVSTAVRNYLIHIEHFDIAAWEESNA